MNGGQAGAVCPTCGSAADVHSIQELADMARMALGEPGQPQAGPLPGGRSGGTPTLSSGYTRDPLDQLGEDVAGIAMGAVAGMLGRAISRRVQNAAGQGLSELAARRQEQLRTQIAIAERHPDLCACLNDGVIFVVGGHRALPMPDLNTVTVEQADALAAQLRG